MTGPVLIAGRGAAARLADVTDALVVASRGAWERLRVAGVPLPRGRLFSEFHANPLFEQALAAARAREESGARLVVGIGGGSALDVAKAARALPADPVGADAVLKGSRAPCGGSALLLVPTTAGTGSEVTRFATLYRDRRKTSLDAPGVRADTALVDPSLTDSCPPELTWSCAFDALAHAVESLWSTRATDESRAHARAALALIVPVLRESATVPLPRDRDRLSEAATLAGRAIDITRTTAAHAFAYPLTVHLGVPHGHACALNLTWLATAVERAAPKEVNGDPAALRAAVDLLREVLGADGRGLGAAIGDLIALRGLATPPLSADPAVVDVVLDEGSASDRMGGTPIAVHPSRFRTALTDMLVAADEEARCATTG